MSASEITTAVAAGLEIIIIIVNNSSYGTIRMHQEMRYPSRVIGTDIENPDFVSLSRSMGACAETVRSTEEFFKVFEKFRKNKTVSVIDLITPIENISSRLRLADV